MARQLLSLLLIPVFILFATACQEDGVLDLGDDDLVDDDDADDDAGDDDTDPGDDDTDPGGLDSDGDGVSNSVDPSIYSYNFDDNAWTDWSIVDLGGGNPPDWSMSDGTLWENSDAADTIATGPDLGELLTYSISVDTMIGGGATDLSAIAFAMVDADEYWLARWHDPTGHYDWYEPPGQLSLLQCLFGECTELASDDHTADLSVSTDTWTSLSVSVDGDEVSVSLGGIERVTYSRIGLAPLGAGIVGVYSYDCDGGVYYDNFEVTNP